ncbi:MAG: right-handed parallel beta-helix repeat-containing protein [Armatimonadetes bacterium]|nr:right-handed parallel beta-helix repeat-containing protein [Armatimonadota bacterium]
MSPMFIACLLGQAQEIKNGGQISASTKLKPGVYRLANSNDDLKQPVLTIAGKGITVDFTGVVLEGSPQTADPDQRKGLGVLVKGENITIRNLTCRGYKVALMALNCPGLKLYNCNFSNNWKQHLQSDQEKENEADWMSYHQNEKDEWLRYGAGAYLRGCNNFEVKNLRVNGGQCGLMLTQCNKGVVWNCDLSFNSGLGLGMYRSSENKVMHNKMDWCVRGYSHGVYNRGQDSAGILVFEQCSKNTFAYNSATHGGDGFFLWAGQHTMDTGEGGCNDNLLFANDFSHSPANAIEATFSRNKFINNKLVDCWHGIWGGYSYDTLVMANMFAMNGEAVAIEHGQKNRIAMNSFSGDTVGVYLWQNANAPDPNWGYPKHRDVRNKDTVVEKNLFERMTETGLILGPGTDIMVRNNLFNQNKNPLQIQGAQSGTVIEKNVFMAGSSEPTVEGVKFSDNIWEKDETDPGKPWMSRGGNANPAMEPEGPAYLFLFEVPWNPMADLREKIEEAEEQKTTFGLEEAKEVAQFYVKPLSGGVNPFLKELALRGRRYILMDEWGPYDFKRPLLWPRIDLSKKDPHQAGRTFEVLGPEGKWKVKSLSKGVKLTASEGKVPGSVTATWSPSEKDIDIELVYTGGETTDYRGIVTAAGSPIGFGWSKSFLPIDWNVKFWSWDESRDPRTKLEAYESWMVQQKPLATMKATELSFATGGSPFEGVPGDHFATLAEGGFEVDGGNYLLNVTSDDGVRVWLDGKLVVDEWHWQGPTLYTKSVALANGSHKLKVEHFEIDGYTALKVEVKPKR